MTNQNNLKSGIPPFFTNEAWGGPTRGGGDLSFQDQAVLAGPPPLVVVAYCHSLRREGKGVGRGTLSSQTIIRVRGRTTPWLPKHCKHTLLVSKWRSFDWTLADRRGGLFGEGGDQPSFCLRP